MRGASGTGWHNRPAGATLAVRLRCGGLCLASARKVVADTSGRAWSGALLKGCVLMLLICCPPGTVLALDPQQPFSSYAHEIWSVNDGLPFPGGYELAQDADGYLWIGSIAGLARFDGSRVVTYDASNTPALRSNLIRGLATDAYGRLWIGTDRGLAVYTQGQFTAVPGMQDRRVRVLGFVDDLMLVADSDAVLGMDADLEIRTRHAVPGALGMGQLGDELWFSTSQPGLYCICAGAPSPVMLPGIGQGTAEQFALAGDVLWVTTFAGLYHNEGAGWQRHPDPRLHERVISIAADRDGNLWVGMERRLLRLHDGQIVEDVDIGAMAPSPRRLFEDRDGSLWLASQLSGLHRFWNGLADFIPLQVPAESGHYIWAVAAWNGELLAGGTFGLARQVGDELLPIDGTQGLPEIYSLRADGDSLLLGTVRGVYRYDRDGHLESPAALRTLGGEQVNAFLRDRANRLWIGTRRGLYRLDADGTLHQIMGHDHSDRWQVRVLTELRDGRLLAGGDGGLWELAGETAVPVPLPDADIELLAIHETGDGRLLLGSFSSGRLYLQDGPGWLPLGPERGTPVNEVYTIATDGRGKLLVNGLRGAYLIPERQLAELAADPDASLAVQGMLTINRQYLPGQQVYCCLGGGDGRALHYQGRFHLAAPFGIFVLRPGVREPGNSHTRIDRLSTGRRPGMSGPALSAAPLSMSADERDLQFEFSAVSLLPTHTPRLRYRLHGYDRHWRRLPMQAQPRVQYTNLPPGEYRFEVVDEAAAGPSQQASLSFSVAPRFHETLWFRLASALAVTVVLLAITRCQQRRLIGQQRSLEREVAMRTDELRSAYERMDQLSRTDALTGIHNRRHASEEIPARLHRLRDDSETIASGHGVLLVLLDIDHFKAINDDHGHRAGDQVLQEVARRLALHMRHDDCLVRWGGEEFLLVHFGIAPGQQEALAERACAAVRDTPVQIDGRSLAVTASIGMVLVPATAEALALDWEQLVHMADAALYEAKRGGRNRWYEAQFTMQRPRN